MFDFEKLTICLNALHESEVDDDKLALILEANKNNSIAVKTPAGELSRREKLK